MANIKQSNSSLQNPAWLFLFAVVALDSLFSYFGRNLAGIAFPVNSLLPLWLVIAVFKVGIKQLIPPLSSLIWVTAAVTGFLVGIVIIPGEHWFLLFKIGTAVTAFIIGVGTGRWNNDANQFIKLFLIVGGIYVAVCTVALLQLFPSILPVEKDIGNYQGNLIVRPSVTVDQNFQIFYVFMPALVLSMRFKKLSGGFALFFTICALFVLAKLQTRSGVILIANVVLFSLLAPLRFPHLGRRKIIALPVIILILLALSFDQVIESSEEITQRFSQQRFNTFYGRLYSAQYMFENLLNPEFWLPRGEAEFVRKTGNIPHFTPTAFYLQGGLLAIIAWVAIFMVPLLKMSRMFLKGRLDEAGVMIFIGSLTAFIAQLSLNAPYFEQTWLWAAAAIGTIKRLDRQARLKPRVEKSQEWPNQHVGSTSLGKT